jgi:hypothetical protein
MTMNDKVTYYVEFDPATDMKGLVDKLRADLIAEGDDGNPTIINSAGNGLVLGATSYTYCKDGYTTYEICLNKEGDYVEESLFKIVFNALPSKETYLELVVHVLTEGRRPDTYEHVGSWNIDIFMDSDLSYKPFIRVTGSYLVDAKLFNDQRPSLPGGTWYIENDKPYDSNDPAVLSTVDFNALLNKHRY